MNLQVLETVMVERSKNDRMMLSILKKIIQAKGRFISRRKRCFILSFHMRVFKRGGTFDMNARKARDE